MTVFLDLPNELLSSILELLPRQNLIPLCLVSKALCRISQPLLFSQIKLGWDKDSTPPIVSLLQCIIRRPDLAARVKELNLDGATDFFKLFVGKPPPKIILPSDLNQLDLLSSSVESTGVAFDSLWIQELRDGTMDAFIALLVAKLPELKALHILYNFAKENVSLLHKVDSLYDYDVPKARSNAADAPPLFYLPALQHLVISIDNPPKFSWPGCTPNSQQLKSLDISITREAQLQQILQVTPALESLRWHWFYDPNTMDEHNCGIVDLSQIASSLSPVSATLTELRLSGSYYFYQADCDWPKMDLKGSLQSLRGFSKLRVFKAPYIFLVGLTADEPLRLEDVLPENLEHLVLSDEMLGIEGYEWTDWELLEALEDWIQTAPKYTPKFQSFTLDIERSGMPWGPLLRETLSEICSKAGLDCLINKKHPDSPHDPIH